MAAALCLTYTDVFDHGYCNCIIQQYDKMEKQKSEILDENNNFVKNLDVRNVESVSLPIEEGIAPQLARAAQDANVTTWNFNVTCMNQCEFLKYSAMDGGKYEAHLDTVLEPSTNNCRKITAIAFLNDNYEGGRFFIQETHQKTYIEHRKGSVIVFPSFLLHGVEPVTKGIRYSVVTWLLGPWFR